MLMTSYELIWIAASTGGFAAFLTILIARRESGNPVAAAVLCALFAGYTAVQIGSEGVIGFYTNHTRDLTGVQVWWDLLMCALIALFLIAPRARGQGMNVTGWALLVLATASIGLLAMCARLFWLENARSANLAERPAAA
jgi:hypothetical protein